ncbi:MAG: hypothetical protein PHV79_01675, partial [Clostridia bacterium]|nr:hypothetical protein [Clostridia bacterium]
MRRNLSQHRKNILEITKYFCFFLAFYIMTKAGIYQTFYPFAFGLFFALIWCNQKVQYLSPLYILACLLSDSSVLNIINVLFTVSIVLMLCFIHIKLKKPIKIPLFCFYAVLSQVAYV